MFTTRHRAGAVAALALLLAGAGPALGQSATPGQKEREAKALAVLARADATRFDRTEACRELSYVGTKDAVAPLAKLLTDPDLADNARYALEPIPDPAVDAALREALLQAKDRLLVGVIGSLGVRRDRAAVEPLSKLLASDDALVASAAARALGAIGTPEAAKAIEGTMAKVEGAALAPLAEGLFRCADHLAAAGQRAEAATLLDRLADAKFPAQVRTGALAKARLLKMEQAKGL